MKDGNVVETVTSMKENTSTIKLQKKNDTTVTMMDWPGHPRLRLQVGDYFPITKKIIFLVDISDSSSWSAAAEYELIIYIDFCTK